MSVDLISIIHSAWQDALEGRADLDNSKRSTAWVNFLGENFKKQYQGNRYRVFWKGNTENWKHFRRQEFLFDVLVCSIDTIPSFQQPPRNLEFIAQCHWQIESEFNNRNAREIVIDMSKLVIGEAENKLFITSHREEEKEKELLDRYAEIAACCSGNFYFCFITHPNEWDDNPEGPVVYRYRYETKEFLPL